MIQAWRLLPSNCGGAGRALVATAAILLAEPVAARAQDTPSDPAAICRQAGDDDRLRPIPVTLATAARRLFELRDMPEAVVQRSTVFRCMDGTVMLCNSGANLACGPADSARDLPGATRWCQEHPGAPAIPMVATGHATIYRWHCDGTKARADAAVERLDSRGFITRVWKRLD